MDMKKYTIDIYGCDDTTSVVMELNEVELEVIERLCAKTVEISSYQCMPTMEVEEVDE